MRQGGGKAKGLAFERQTCRALSSWLTAGLDPNQLIWSIGSGGWRSKEEGEEGWRQVGDLAPNGDAGERFRRRFAVECKHRRAIDFWHTFTAKPGENLHGWWLKLCSECAPYDGLKPMLVVKANNKPTVVGVPGLELLIPTAIVLQYEGECRAAFVPLTELVRLDPEEVLNL